MTWTHTFALFLFSTSVTVFASSSNAPISKKSRKDTPNPESSSAAVDQIRQLQQILESVPTVQPGDLVHGYLQVQTIQVALSEEESAMAILSTLKQEDYAVTAAAVAPRNQIAFIYRPVTASMLVNPSIDSSRTTSNPSTNDSRKSCRK